jgi:hypothetical protein
MICQFNKNVICSMANVCQWTKESSKACPFVLDACSVKDCSAVDTSEYIGVQHFAHLYNYNAQYVRNMCNAGKIPGAKKIKTAARGMWIIPKNTGIVKFKRT